MLVFIASVLVRKTSLFTSDGNNENLSNECWENIIGNELYKLYIFQVLLSIGFNTIIFEYLVTIVAKSFKYVTLHLCQSLLSIIFSLYVPSFDIAVNGVDIITSSCFCWLGWYFCPVLSVLTLLNIGLTFYSKWMSIAFFCLPPKELFNINSCDHTEVCNLLFSKGKSLT